MSTIMNFILEGNLKQTVLYTYSTIMNFILEGKLCFTETKRLCRITLYVYWLLNCFVAILYTIVRNYNRLQDTGTDKDTGVYRDTGAHVQGKLTSILVEIRWPWSWPTWSSLDDPEERFNRATLLSISCIRFSASLRRSSAWLIRRSKRDKSRC